MKAAEEWSAAALGHKSHVRLHVKADRVIGLQTGRWVKKTVNTKIADGTKLLSARC